ncbi:hypothetical protein LC048_13760 [Mesobacillus subterraneus]|uniref:hypothetical protein n=1 Tax=Mesobacillus subterraneus TaxID=285983 RepID=UPI001CFEBA54|nr:hypothetical protein [Mesobacillus subterraneus]WLR53589.1 hypothetical protein LC048_13760 [Mesobacillus subterraneus]
MKKVIQKLILQRSSKKSTLKEVSRTNAAEARKLSNDNAPKLVDKLFNEAVTKLDEKIKISAANGNYNANLIINSSKDIMDKVIQRLESHYQNEGYEVKVRGLWLEKMFMVSWQK